MTDNPTGYDIPEAVEPGEEVVGDGSGQALPPIEEGAEAEPQADGLEEPTAEETEEANKIAKELTDIGLPTEAITAFACVLSRDGIWMGTSRLDLVSFIGLDREAHMTDIVSGTRMVEIDAEASRRNETLGQVLSQLPGVTASMVVAAQAAQVQKMTEEASARQILTKVQREGGLRGPRG